MRYLVDSDWIIDALSNIPASLETLLALSSDGLAISVISLAEVLEGAFGAPDPSSRVAQAREFLSGFVILPVGDAIAEQFARLRSHLRKQGNLIPDFDLLVAATALHHDMTLLTRNRRHFERIPDLKLYQAR